MQAQKACIFYFDHFCIRRFVRIFDESTNRSSMRPYHHLKPEEKIVLLSADIQPDQKVLAQIDHLLTLVTDWDYFAKIVIGRAAAPLFNNKLPHLSNSTSIPGRVLTKFKQASLKTLCRNMLLTETFRQIITAFSQEGIPVVALKGAYLSEWLYGNIGLRQFSDLDLLVSPPDGLRCLEILKQMGFESTNSKLSDFLKEHMAFLHYPPMIRKGVSVEVHLRIHSQLESYQVDLDGMWKRALPAQMHGVEALSFSPNDLLIHLCLHIDKHMAVGRVQFTCFYDLTNLLNHKAELLDWTLFEKQCEEYHTVAQTYHYLLLVHRYMNARLPESVLEKYGSMLRPKDMRRFECMLKGQIKKTNLSSVLLPIKQMKNIGQVSRFLFELLFPGKAYMIKRYRISNALLLPFYYVYRFFHSFRNVWNQLMNELH
jgi:hypothetical protein